MSPHSGTVCYSLLPYSGESSRSIVARLNQEWEDRRWDPADWMVGSPPLEAVLQTIGLDPDHMLCELIRACQNGYAAAGRVIVQALLPKLILMSRTFPFPPVDNLVSALWIRISRYPLHHRPKSVAANLLLDAKKDVLAENRAAPAATVTADPGTDLTAPQVLAAARDLHLATPESLAIVEMVYVEGMPKDRVAQLYSISADAVRQRCSDTVKRLRKHRDLLLELC